MRVVFVHSSRLAVVCDCSLDSGRCSEDPASGRMGSGSCATGHAMGGNRPSRRREPTFSNVSENKSSDRKLSLSPFVSSACYHVMSNSHHFEGYEDILTP